MERIRGKRNVIWDWNGTLVDDVDITVESLNVLRGEHGLPPMDVGTYRETFGFPIRDFYERMGFDLGAVDFGRLSVRYHEEYHGRKMARGRLFPDAVPHLEAVGREGRQSILSAASQGHLDAWVGRLGVAHHFEHVFGVLHRLTDDKTERGRELMETAGYRREETVFIGDTHHDAEVAEAIGVEALIVAEGHQSYGRLAALRPRVLESRRPPL